MQRMIATIAAVLLAMPAWATDVSVVGLFPNKAVLVVDDAPPKTYSVGSTIADGIRLVASDRNGATIESNGRRRTIAIGEYISRRPRDSRASATLQADSLGHYMAQGQINGGAVQMLLDTGASLVAIPASEADRLGIDYSKGSISRLRTANGVVVAHRVVLDSVKVGDIEIHQVEAVVQDSGLPFILLGMSFLNRTAMQREGQQMVLTRRY